MASQPPVPDSLAAVQSAASQEFATAYAAASGTPEGQSASAEASPAPVPAPTAEGAPPAPATPPAPQQASPSTPTTLDPSTWSPEARRSLEMEGWDGHSPITPDLVAKVAERKLEFNNRLAEQSRQARTTPQPEPQPAQQPTPEPRPVAPELDITQVPAQVTASLDSDPSTAQMVSQYVQNDARLRQLNGDPQTPSEVIKAQQDYFYEQRRLEAPEVKADPVLSDETLRRVQLSALTLERLLSERERLTFSQDALSQRYDRKASEVRARLEGQITERVAATRRAEEAARSWQPSLERVFASPTNPVPTDQRPFVAKYVADAFTARVREGSTVPDIEGFMTQTTKEALSALDAYHRSKMGQYGAQAHARTDVVTPPPANGFNPSPAPTNPQQSQQPQTLADLYRQVDRDRYGQVR